MHNFINQEYLDIVKNPEIKSTEYQLAKPFPYIKFEFSLI